MCITESFFCSAEKLAQYCKSTILPLKKKTLKKESNRLRIDNVRNKICQMEFYLGDSCWQAQVLLGSVRKT